MKRINIRAILSFILVVSMVLSICTPLGESLGLSLRAFAATDINFDQMNFSQILQHSSPLTWVVTGDSITHNETWSQGSNSYGEWIEQYLLGLEARKDDTVALTGWGGTRIEHFVPTCTTTGMGTDEFITRYNPDVVFVKLGMNDRDTKDSDFISRYNAMLDEIYAKAKANRKTPKVVVMTPTPVSGETLDNAVMPYEGRDSVYRFKGLLEGIVRSYNAEHRRNIELVDLWTAFTSERLVVGDDYFYNFFYGPSDGAIHPNAAGQYLIFKTLSKTLGFYNPAEPIFCQEYDDINEGYMYVDGTKIDNYSGDYDAPNRVDDNEQMNKGMPSSNLLASVDFNSTNGVMKYKAADAAGDSIDLTVAGEGVDTLTVEEIATVGTEYSVVFRAKLDTPGDRSNMPVFYLSTSQGTKFGSNNINELMLGVPGISNVYYKVANSGTAVSTNTGGTTNFDGLVAALGDDQWHTVAIVQSNSGLTFYIDGVAYEVRANTNNGAITLSQPLSALFGNTAEADFDAAIGRYSANDSDKYWKTQGNFDYWQFYRGALTAAEVQTLSGTDANAEMNETMPTITDASALSSVDFTSQNGKFTYNTSNISASTVDLTVAANGVNTLTVEEIKTVGKEYSVVFHAKLNPDSSRANQPIFYFASTKSSGFGNQDDLLMMGVPGNNSGKNLYYVMRADNSDAGFIGATTNYGNLATVMNDGNWHQIAIVQSETGLTYYVDGTAYTVKKNNNTAITLNVPVSTIFDDVTAENFDAVIGRYGKTDTNWKTQGDFDYWQFYGTALTADQVVELADISEMNSTMPKLPIDQLPDLLASVDFTSSNGKLDFNGKDGLRIDTATEGYDIDPLTKAEAASLGTDFSVVFNAKLGAAYNTNQPILFISSNGTANWDNALVLGTAGTSNQLFYQLVPEENDGNSKLNKSGVIGLSGTPIAGDGDWHTVAITVDGGTITYYVDGDKIDQKTGYSLKDGYTSIGSLFENATNFAVQIGRYGTQADGTSFKLKGDFNYWQFYNGALTADQVAMLSPKSDSGESSKYSWSDLRKDESLWLFAGAEQLSGYQGTVSNRSLFRLIENTVRSGLYDDRDLRAIMAAAPGYSVQTMVDNYDALIAKHSSNYDAFMLLPEVSAVYADGYQHSADLVTAYKTNIETLIQNNSDKITVLWTPLASNDSTINGYITDYADAVREIATANTDILFFDANKFMNEKMTANNIKTDNWFEEDMYISPLCALDVARAFFAHINYRSDDKYTDELKKHDLRVGTDTRPVKTYVRDYIDWTYEVSGSSVTVDTSAITTAYPNIENLRVVILENVGIGSFYKGNWDNYAAISNNAASFTVPWNDPVVTVYGELNGYTYRFKDQTITAKTQSPLTVGTVTADLTGLEVVGAPAIGFTPDKTEYDVTLYQYQRKVQIRAQGGDNLTIKVNGIEVAPDALSQQIAVESTATVTVTVTGGTAGDKTYKLNLKRPASADIIITEVMQNSDGGKYDLIEIYNASGKNLDLSNYAIGYKKDYVDSTYTTQNKGEHPWYFTGDDQAFNSRYDTAQTYTTINDITKSSSYWDGYSAESEKDAVIFPANSTMVLWVKSNGTDLTYDSLINFLKDSNTTYTIGETKVVPTTGNIAMAERPKSVTLSGIAPVKGDLKPGSSTYFHLDDFSPLTNTDGNNDATRGWLFVLKDTAVRDNNGSVTEAGDDIISAGMYVRPTASLHMSTVLYYDTDRGMSVVKNPVSFNATEEGAPYYSSQYSYSNYTTFGAIEYWQKPANTADTQDPTALDKTPAYVINGTKVTIDLTLQDDTDVRYFELYVKKADETEYTKVEAKDFVLESCVANSGVSADQTSIAYTYDLGTLNEAASYYYTVTDGSGEVHEFDPQTVNVVPSNALNVNMSVANARNEVVTGVTADVTIELTKGENTAELADSYTVTLGEKSYTTVNGKVTIPMANGDRISIANLPAGTAYTVTVAEPEGYTAESRVTTGTIAAGAASGVSVKVQADKKHANLTVNMNIDKYYGDAAASSVEANVQISVTTDANADHDLSGSYTTSIDGVVLSKNGDTNVWTATVALNDTENIVINGLPVGAQYTLTVTPAAGYKNITTSNTGTVAASGTTVTWNVKQNDPATGTLKVTMSVADASSHNVTITVNAGADYDLTGTYAITGNVTGALAKDGNVWKATIAMTNGQEASVVLPQGATYSVTLEDKANYTESAAATGTISESQSTATMVASREEGSLKIGFNASDYKGNATSAAVSGSVVIEISDTAGTYNVKVGTETVGTISNGCADITLTNGKIANVEGLLAGTTYTVTFTAPNGYTSTTTGTTAGTITKDTASEVAFSAKENTPTAADMKITLAADDTIAHGMIITVVTNVSGSYTVTNEDGSQSYAAFVQDAQNLNQYTATLTNITAGWEGYIRDLPVGATYTVEPVPAVGYQDNSTAAQLSGTVGTEDGEVAVSIGKVPSGSLEVNLSAKDYKDTAIANGEVEGTVSVQLAGNHLSGEYVITGGNQSVTLNAANSYTATVVMKNGATLRVANLPAGTTYTISVDVPNGYRNVTTDAISGTITANQTAPVTLTVKQDTPELDDLSVSMSIKGEDGTTADTTVDATVTVTLNGNLLTGDYDLVVGSNTVKLNAANSYSYETTLRDGETIKVKDVPVGTSYTVNITAPEGYELKSPAVVNGTVNADTAVITPSVQKTKAPAGDLKITVQVSDADGKADNTTEVTATITLSVLNRVALSGSYDIMDANRQTIGTIKADPNGVYTGSVTVKNGMTLYVKNLPQGVQYKVTLTMPNTHEDKSLTLSGTVQNSESEIVLDVHQKQPEQPQVGGLKFSLTVIDSNGSADNTTKATVTITLVGTGLADSYDIKDVSGSKIGTITKSGDSYVGTVSLGNGGVAAVMGIPAGTQFTAKVTVPDGFTAKTEATVTGTVAKDATAPAAVSIQKNAAEDGKTEETTAPTEDGKTEGTTAPTEDGKTEGTTAPTESGNAEETTKPTEGQKPSDSSPDTGDGIHASLFLLAALAMFAAAAAVLFKKRAVTNS